MPKPCLCDRCAYDVATEVADFGPWPWLRDLCAECFKELVAFEYRHEPEINPDR